MPHAGLRQRAGVGGRACSHGADAEQRGDDRHRLRARQLVAQPLLMAAGHVAGLVGQHADDLVRRFRRQQRAGVDEDAAPVDEGVEARSLTRMILMPDFERPAACRIGRA